MQKVLHTAFPSHGESFSNSHVQKMQLFLAMANKKLTSLLARPTKSVISKLPNSCNDFKWLEWEFVVREFLTISRYKDYSPKPPKTDPWIWYNYMYWRIFPPASFDGPGTSGSAICANFQTIIPIHSVPFSWPKRQKLSGILAKL